MLIRSTNVRAKLLRATEDERAWLSDYLSYEQRGSHGEHKRYSLLVEGAFPAGLLALVQTHGRAAGHRIEVARPQPPCAPDARPLLDWLRDYQLAAVQVARTQHRGVYHHVTAAGKTETMIGLTELYPDVEWLVLVHRKTLLHQTAERFAMRTGELVGRIGDGLLEPGRITIAMTPTLASLVRKKQWATWLAQRGGLIVDECHTLSAPVSYRLAQRCTGAYFRYGFSGTPFARTDQRNIFLLGAIGPTIHRVRAADLVAAGVVARPVIRMVPVPQLIKRTTWQDVYTRGVVQSKERNAAVVSVVRAARKPCLLFVTWLEHGRRLLKLLQQANVEAEFVFGKHNTPQRTAAIRRLVHGDIDVLIANAIFQEGVDIPELQSVVIAAGGKSAIVVLQDLGRGMRKRAKNGDITKEEVEIYDFMDTGNVWLQKHAKARLRTYTRERHKVVIGNVIKGKAR